jgi:hypothetical protein
MAIRKSNHPPTTMGAERRTVPARHGIVSSVDAALALSTSGTVVSDSRRNQRKHPASDFRRSLTPVNR